MATIHCLIDNTLYFLSNFSLSVGHCPSSFIQIGHPVQFVGLSSDNLILSVCYKNGDQTVMVLYDVTTLGGSVSANVYTM